MVDPLFSNSGRASLFAGTAWHTRPQQQVVGVNQAQLALRDSSIKQPFVPPQLPQFMRE